MPGSVCSRGVRQCERAIGGLGESAGKVEIDECVLRKMTVEEWCGDNVEVVRQIHRVV